MGALRFDEGSHERGATYVWCCTAATVIHTTPMGHDQEGGNEERESGRVGLGEKDVLSNVVRTTGLLDAGRCGVGGW